VLVDFVRSSEYRVVMPSAEDAIQAHSFVGGGGIIGK
jgi:hypothetical protein